ncbi:MAG: HD domain-containing protein [Proteobacteria bacterium]|nr:HD domain-containing protein [Pseudomonadota bacterium]NDC25356.1 HD domain-containing protein [Pseudomonadota bacterium]NDD05179.1 HD domain-containing protein [Pseudomonadota bacterium]NDG25932.1 HD domain-containing protein [Pseudomonadota bacterium]
MNEQIPVSPAPITKVLFVRDLQPKDTVRSSFLVKSKEILQNKAGKAYLAMILADKTGEIDCRVWNDAEGLSQEFQEGDVIAVGGKLGVFQNKSQLALDHISPLAPHEYRLEDYLPQAPEDLDRLYLELVQIFSGLENSWVKQLGLALLQDPEIAERYRICPAAKTIHHAFIGGLLCHSLQLIKLVDAVLPFYPFLNRDLLVFGAAFHDFGKIYELRYEGKVGYTDEGRLVGHIAIGLTLIDRKIQTLKGFPKDLENHLKHLILSHHGKLEHGSPKVPHTLEAEVLHWLDHMDSRINSIQNHLMNETQSSGWTNFHKAYGTYFHKTPHFNHDSLI